MATKGVMEMWEWSEAAYQRYLLIQSGETNPVALNGAVMRRVAEVEREEEATAYRLEQFFGGR